MSKQASPQRESIDRPRRARAKLAHRRGFGSRPTAVIATLVAVCASAVLAASAGASDFTWSGAAAEPKWSNGTNWAGTAPSGAVGTLTFPSLTSAACTAEPPKATCYQGENDLSGLSANAISIDDGAGYMISGHSLTLGSGGISASTSRSSFSTVKPSRILLPIVLSSPQTWSVDGNNINAQLDLEGNVTGASDALKAVLSHQTFLAFESDAEVGPVSVTVGSGFGDVALGFPGHPAKLNATDGNAVSFSGGAGFFAGNGTVGPLTMTGGGLQVGEAPNGGGLAVLGGVTLDSASTFSASISKPGNVAGTDYTQMSASGTVKLGESALNLYGLEFPSGGGAGHCPTLHVGDIDTIVTTSGSLTGTFKSVPDGTTVPIACSPGTEPTARINYTASTVTATILTSGSGGGSCASLEVETKTLPAATRGVPYKAELKACGGTPPYKWAKSAPLPKGLKLAKTGVISGTPSKKLAPGSYPVDVKVSDKTKQSASTSLSLSVS